LFTLAKLPIEAFRQPITIAVEPGETEQVLFCRIYNPSTGNSVYAPYPDDVDWAAVTARAIDKITAARSKPMPEPTDDRPALPDLSRRSGPTPHSTSPTPHSTPIADPLTGQTSLIPEEDSAIVDALSTAIRSIRTPYDATIVRRDIESRRSILGEPMWAGVMARFNQADGKLDYQDAIGQEVTRLGWAPEQASQKFQEWYSVATRSAMSSQQLRECFAKLRSLKVQGVR
jgi:hypothetical protein